MLIGEVARRSGVSVRMLRHYDRVGVVSPSLRTSAGYRSYTREDLDRLLHVEMLRTLGLTLQQAAAAVDDPALAPATLVERLTAYSRAQVERHRALLRDLERVRASEPADWSDVLRTVALLRGLDAADPLTRHRTALAVVGPATHDAAPLAAAFLGEEDPVVAGALLWALVSVGDASVPALATALAGDEQARRRASEGLAKLASPTSRAVLAQALGHEDPVVARRAAVAAGENGDPRAISQLVAQVAAGIDDLEAAETLAGLATDHACAERVDDEIAAVMARSDPDVRLRLTALLADVPTDRSRELLATLADDPDRQVALTARHLLGSDQG